MGPNWCIVLWVPGVTGTAPQPTLVWLGDRYSMLHVIECDHLLLNLGFPLLFSSNGSQGENLEVSTCCYLWSLTERFGKYEAAASKAYDLDPRYVGPLYSIMSTSDPLQSTVLSLRMSYPDPAATRV